ncbi:MAG: thioredoxin [Treponematales bacterium]
MSAELTITAGNFDEEVVNSSVPVLLDFWAPWCGPCRMLGPVVTELAGEYSCRVKVGKVNIDEEAAIAERHEIASIPTLVVYHHGKVIARKTGAAPKRDIEALFKDLV